VSALRKNQERRAAKIAAVRAASGVDIAGLTPDGKQRVMGKNANPDRVAEVERLWLMRLPSGEIAHRVAKKFGVTTRTIEDDLARVARADAELAGTVCDRVAAREQCRKLAADLAKLDGLDEPQKVEHGGIVSVQAVTSGAARARIEELLAKARAIVGDASTPTDGDGSGVGDEPVEGG